MATVKFRNINPQGAVDLPLIGRTLEAGEVFEVDASLAGEAATGSDDDGTFVAGHGLLGQVGTNYELVVDKKSADAPATKNEG